MSTPGLEERLREELKRLTGQVQPGALRPPRVPARRRWLFPAMPAAVCALVTGLVTVLVAMLVAGLLPASRLPVTAAVMPRYYVSVAEGHGTGSAVPALAIVHESVTGRVTGSATLPFSWLSGGFTASAAADDRVFVIAWEQPQGRQHRVMFGLARLTIDAAGRPERLTHVGTFHTTAAMLGKIALSPDATMAAISLGYGIAPANPSYGGIEVVDLATRQTRTWTAPTARGYWPGTPTWGTDGQTLRFTWLHATGPNAYGLIGIRELDTAAPGANLLASRLVTFPASVLASSNGPRNLYVQTFTITADGRHLISALCQNSSPIHQSGPGAIRVTIRELSATNGTPIRTFRTEVQQYASPLERYMLTRTCNVQSVDPSGGHLLVEAFAFGRIDDGVFTPLPDEKAGLPSVW